MCDIRIDFYPDRVLNTFKSMVTDEDILEKDDLHILDRMKVFVASEEVSRFGAAKPLTAQIERAVRQSYQYTLYVT